MDYNQAFAISAAGMLAERTRVEVASLNLANANTVQMGDSPAYTAMRTVLRPELVSIAGSLSFSDQFDQQSDALSQLGIRLPTASIEPSGNTPRWVYEPGHPLANDKGFVAYANVDSATEMITLMSAMRAYEANVAAMNTAKTIAMRALDIGSGS